MTIFKFKPENRFHPVNSNFLTFSDLMNDFYGFNHENHSVQKSRPAVNIIEDKNEFRLEFALPGYSKEKVKIEVENDVLKVSGKFPFQESPTGELKKIEFLKNDFERNFILPETIDSENIKGSMENGILTIQLPLKEEVKPAPAKTINIA